MSIKVSIQSTDVKAQMEVLEHFPEIADKHYRPALKKDLALLESSVRGNIPTRSGVALSTFGSKLSGRGFRLRGRVGWLDASDPWYINVVEHGAQPHNIQVQPQNRQALTWGGNFSKGHGIQHPGFSARGFMAAGFASVQTTVETDLAMANEKILAELRIK